MNKYEHYISTRVIPTTLLPGRVYTGHDMGYVERMLLNSGFRWATGGGPDSIDGAIRVDENGHMWHANEAFYRARFPELEVVIL